MVVSTRSARKLIVVGAFIVGALVAGTWGYAQVPAQIVRAVTAKEGGLTPTGETETFSTEAPKAVCWVQVVATFGDRTIQFRWVSPAGAQYRLSPVVPLVPGREVIWDEIPVKGTPAEGLPGTWRVDILLDGQLAQTVYFRIIALGARPLNVAYETSLNLRAVHTWRRESGYEGFHWHAIDQRLEILLSDGGSDFSLRLSGGLSGGSLGGEGRGSIVALFNHPAGYSITAGREWRNSLDQQNFDRLTVIGTTTFLDLSYTRGGLSMALSVNREDLIDRLDPLATNETTSVLTASVSYSRQPWAATLGYTRSTLEDRTGNPFSGVTALTGSLAYSPAPSRFALFGTFVHTVNFSGATPFSDASTLITNNTILRGLYFATSDVTLGATYGFGGSEQDDGLFDSRTYLFGADAAWRLSPVFTLRGTYQAQTVDSRFEMVASRTTTTTVLGALEYRPRPDLFLSLIYSQFRAELTDGVPTTTSALTGVLSYFPSPKFSLSATYSQASTAEPFSSRSGTGNLNLRYDIQPNLRLVVTVQTLSSRFDVSPISDFDRVFYTSTLTWQY